MVIFGYASTVHMKVEVLVQAKAFQIVSESAHQMCLGDMSHHSNYVYT